MTYLELCKRAREESGISGQNQPASVSGQQGILQRMVKWVDQANIDIQLMRDSWSFLWSKHVEKLTIGKFEYSTLELGSYEAKSIDSFYIGSRPLTQICYDKALQMAKDGQVGEPRYYSKNPGGDYLFLPIPDLAYDIEISQYSKPVSMVNDGDESVIPAEYHMAIVHLAVSYYASYDDAQQVKADQYELFDKKYGEMINDLTPAMSFDKTGFYV